MDLNVVDFGEFFRQLNGYDPFAWQVNLVERVIASGRWPDRIAAPTSSGKTSVIDVHLFLNALAQAGGVNLPRRMIMTVNRRSLVDDHAQHARRASAALAAVLRDDEMAAASTLRKVAELLRLRSGGSVNLPNIAPVMVRTIRGGMTLDRSWNTEPATVAILCITPDMWGSRVLFRGYGTSLSARPMDAGLLVMDSVLVVDEAHLNRQLLLTARRVAELQSAAPERVGPPVLQVVETTATPARVRAPSEVEIAVDERSLGTGSPGELLRRRLGTPKPVELIEVDIRRSDVIPLAEEMAERCRLLAQDERFANVPIGCIANTVGLARAVAARLRSSSGKNAVVEVVGGLRQHDRLALTRLYPRLLGENSQGQDAEPPRFVVGTQALEVGINIDLGALVTELAPAASIVQRAGRVNRFGERPVGPIVVISPRRMAGDSTGPYEADDLDVSAEWLRSRSGTERGLAALEIGSDPPPPTASRRLLFQRLEWHDVERLSRTSDDLAAADRRLPGGGEDLTLWLRDELQDRAEAFVVIRDHEGLNAELAQKVAEETIPLGTELFSVSLYRARSIVRSRKHADSVDREPWTLAFRRNRPELISGAGEVMPGDVLVMPPGTSVLPGPGGETEGNQTLSETDDVYDQVSEAEVKRLPGYEDFWQVSCVLPALPVSNGVPPPPERLSRAREALLALQEESSSALTPDDEAYMDLLENALDAFAGYLRTSAREPQQRQADLISELDLSQLEPESWPEVTVVTGISEAEPMFVRLRQRALPEPEERSERSTGRVYLDDHALAVEERAAALARAVGLTPSNERAVTLAALHHDSGKEETRFQTYLSAGRPQKRPIAKSAYRIPRQLRAGLGLVGWRHEQASAARYFSTCSAANSERDLTTWLIGSSHGRGRGCFDADADILLPHGPAEFGESVFAAAQELYTDGLWDQLFESLRARFGPWGLAYLEGVLRAADQTVSAEGR